jgi:hypothetical protein
VFAASLSVNLLVFVVGQAAALFYVRTGRTGIGLLGAVATWLMLDWWLIARFVQAAPEPELALVAGLLQLVSLLLAGLLAFARWRRRWSRTARQRTELFATGMAQYLRGEHVAAKATFGRLVHTDPWDVAAWIALGDVCGRAGEAKRARRCWRRARAVDTKAEFSDVLRSSRRATGAASA